MNAIRIRTRIDSETLHLPELRDMIGKDVEIIVLDDSAEPLETPGTFLGEAIHQPPPTADELNELRKAAADDPALASLLELYEGGGLDVQAIVELRARG